MNRYEILILTIPELTKDEEMSIEKTLEKLLMANKGSIISFERWGKYQLAYPVKSHDYGVYFLARFEAQCDNELLKEITTLFHIKFNEFVMRHVITALKKGQSLEYRKPQSLEDVPKKHVGLFDKKDSRGGYGPRDLDVDDSDEDVVDLSVDAADLEMVKAASKDSDQKSQDLKSNVETDVIVNADCPSDQNQDEVA